MLTLWLGGAFALGLFVRQLGLPPLVGFLAAGFAFSAAGIEGTPLLDELAHAGVLMLLFAVGLKLRFKNLVRAEVWGTALAHLGFVTAIGAAIFHWGAGVQWPVAVTLAVAMGFSSTVLASKLLEARRELRAFHGRVAIGILIVQDVVAVGLLALNGADAPSPFAMLLLFLPLAQPLLYKLIDLVGHEELLVLFGAVLALAGGWLFEYLGLSSELGALLFGMLLANHQRAQELSTAIWSLKEFLLIGFFLSIGLTGLPTREILLLAIAAVLLVPVKSVLFFFLLLRFGLRARSSFLASLTLASYSEFGLIVASNAVDNRLLDPAWVVFMALVVAISFATSAPLNRFSHGLFNRYEAQLEKLEATRHHPDDAPISLGSAQIAIVGMGRVGTGAYEYLREKDEQVVGVDSDPGKVESHIAEGRKVVYGDADDPGFWGRINIHSLKAIMLTFPDIESKLLVSRQLRRAGYRGLLSATHIHAEEQDRILAAGCDVTYSYFREAGVGFASSTWQAMNPEQESAGSVRPER
ncbi:cation:proton antiporter family protein [Woeseia oceani]|uniref:Uncharacterized protein n=1 Tax=Woeseia oceani TaxID=1548547 RepID=A0A193LIV0_9GAMM|nr:cation:proton antiporter family protein [Woeseia oceani]ANO52319.1 hypothetical protein BA177_15005 [Woeseia oceani]